MKIYITLILIFTVHLYAQVNSTKFGWFNPHTSGGDFLKTKFGNTLTYKEKRDHLITKYSLGYTPVQFKAPYTQHKFSSWLLEAEGKAPVSDRLALGLGLGLRQMQPNQKLKDFFISNGNQIKDQTRPYMKLYFDYMVTKRFVLLDKLFKKKKPLVFTMGYTFAPEYRFNGFGPHGQTALDVKGDGWRGLNLDVATRWEF